MINILCNTVHVKYYFWHHSWWYFMSDRFHRPGIETVSETTGFSYCSTYWTTFGL